MIDEQDDEGFDSAQDELVEDGTQLQAGAPPPPEPLGGPPKNHEHYDLWHNVRRALYAIPTFFRTKINIAGVRATDIHSLNSSLGSSIEQSVVDQLNELRDIWDPKGSDGMRKYQHLAFKRQSTNWPDVLLTSGMPNDGPVMGIELKGWFVLAKEGEPSFRYKVNPSVCSDLDLVAVYPWNLDEVLSGNPFLMAPFVAEARYTAEMRNYYWQHSRRSKGNTNIIPAPNQGQYPKRGDRFSDEPVSDSGKNFGRASRAGIMKEFISTTFDEVVAGIPLNAWNAFFRTFREGTSLEEISSEIRARRIPLQDNEEQDGDLAQLLRQILDYVERVSGKDIPDASGKLFGDRAKLMTVVSKAELQSAFNDARDDAELIIVSIASMAIAATGNVKYVQKRLKDLSTPEVLIEIDMAQNGIFRIKSIKGN